METEANGIRREVTRSEETVSEETRLTNRATASRPACDSAKSGGTRLGRSRCAGALGVSFLTRKPC